MNKEEFAEELKRKRKAANLTQTKMSDVMLIPVQTIKQWEGANRECPVYTQRFILNELERMIESMDNNEKEMKFERDINILIADNCTRNEAIKHLNDGTIVYEDFEENFDYYIKEYQQQFADENDEDFIEYVEHMRLLMEYKGRTSDESWVKYDGKWYFVEYCL